MKKLLGLVLVFGMLLGVSGCGSDGDKDKLQVATVAPYFPYEMISTEGEYEGFDIELMEIIAEKLGYEGVEWQNLEFDASLLAIQNGDVDMGIAGYSPTPDRKKKMDFSMIYYQDNSETNNVVVYKKADGFKTVDDLKGKIAGTQSATIQFETVDSIKDDYNLEVKTFKEYVDIVNEMMIGSVDFMVCEQANADNFTAKYDELASFPLTVGTNSEGNAIAFAKGNKDLIKKVDAIIKELQKDGTIDKLAEKWFQNAKEEDYED